MKALRRIAHRSSVHVPTLLCCFLLRNALSQEAAETRSSTNSTWAIYIGDHSLSPNWDIHVEGAGFWHGTMGQRELAYARPGIRRKLPHGLSAAFTYSHFVIEPFLTGASSAQSEHRPAEDLEWKYPLYVGSMYAGRWHSLSLTHRLRIEQRFRGPSWNLVQRLRYRMTVTLPAPWKTANIRPDYVWLYDEVFINVGPRTTPNALDQNLTTGGLGWTLSPHLQFEVGYLNQYDPRPAGVTATYNHVLLIKLSSNLPFRRSRPSP